MARLKLVRGLSYSGVVTASRERPYVTVEDEDVVRAALESGYFSLVGEPEGDPDGTGEAMETVAEQAGGKELAEMSVSELETFATYRGVSLGGARKKADIIRKLREALPEGDLEGPIYYGSPTMTELQSK